VKPIALYNFISELLKTVQAAGVQITDKFAFHKGRHFINNSQSFY